jgi:cytochrome c5
MIPNLYRASGIVMAMIILVLLNWTALARPKEKQNEASSSEGTSAANADKGPSGEELWSMNCRRCHNLQPSTMYSNAQWDVIVHHMRVRANLTGADARAIAEFLKSSH